ncbi:SlyX family protein [Thioalbus denitrificans]|jgi:SlyX protein|uniref:Protein SlyX homolog n=1 Tax=Thioalbus denitrificans TaxID=547122 RepID=A0A369CHP1_9GAMM|nr:SlyX family protein [Thioalbus denitrificans]RCX33602.1 SlyX protein [Thioalbus denitrificans]
MENRIVDIESRLAFQEDTLDQLNAVVAEQEQRIGHLERQLQEALRLLRALTPPEVASQAEETPPPHY